MKTTGQVLLEACARRSWSQAELARRSGIHSSKINRLVKNKNTLSLQHAKTLADLFAESPQTGEPESYLEWLGELTQASVN
ncbi:MAG: hypothetical protein Unbinned7358contig1000_28 [Prokaryotic dsDNA virus sp.]|nr:MAG: hypothetical protein Unbinned7358contig1000_28 [Prokaryotic dsDNA virus sp.]|tara:strand:- start:42187 stop:42429 length:243 start_codon:yes stop_codon:yes gene_type:complete